MDLTSNFSIQNYSNSAYPASGIGVKACELVHSQYSGTIFGMSSRGIFIKTPSRWLVFISKEPYLGPLTINFPMMPENLAPGDKIDISYGEVSLREDLVISTHHLTSWQPETPDVNALSVESIRQRLISASVILSSSKDSPGLNSLLPFLISPQDNARIITGQKPRWIEDFYNELQRSNKFPSSNSIVKLLGSGHGLTPSGDDFNVGYLLALNRWGHLLSSPANLTAINQQIVSAAYQKTTTLSANLIECAVMGMADQRLIDALDWLVAGKGHDVRVIEDLLSWGSSSGGDALVGFVAALVFSISAQ
jgi:hypothetical protein